MIITKEELKKIDQQKGEILGHALKNKFRFVLQKMGEKEVRAVEKEMKKLGYPLKYEEILDFKWYPVKLDIIVLLVIKNLFNLNKDQIRESGRFSAKISIIAKIMMRYFVSIPRMAKEVGKYWEKYRTCGKLKSEEVNMKKKYVILVLEDFQGHPVFCQYLEGYIWQVASYVTPRGADLKVKEIECLFRGGRVHKFKMTW